MRYATRRERRSPPCSRRSPWPPRAGPVPRVLRPGQGARRAEEAPSGRGDPPPRRLHEPPLPHEDGREGRVQVRRPAPRRVRGDLHPRRLRHRQGQVEVRGAPGPHAEGRRPGRRSRLAGAGPGGPALRGRQGRGQGGGREAPEGRPRRRDLRASRRSSRRAPRTRTPSSTSAWATPERRCTRRRVGPLDPGHGARAPRSPAPTSSSASATGQLGDPKKALDVLRQEPRARPRQRPRPLQLRPDPLRDEPGRRGARALRAGLASKPDDPDLLEMAGKVLHPRRRSSSPRWSASRRPGPRPTDPAKLALLDELIRKTKALVR